MPVPTDIDNLSPTPGSNFPTGSESPATFDDYMRTHAAFIAQLRDGKASSSDAVLLTGDQTIAGVKTFSSTIAGSISGNAATATNAVGPAASDTTPGLIELSTAAEFLTGTSATLVPPVSVIRDGVINLGAPVASTSGTSIDFTNIPSWVKEINVFFDGFSTNGTSTPIVQLGVEATGYDGAMGNMGNGAVSTVTPMSVGFAFAGVMAAGVTIHATLTLRRSDPTSHKWSATIIGGRSDASNALAGGGSKTLSSALTQVRITTVGGVNTFDAGAVNVSWS